MSKLALFDYFLFQILSWEWLSFMIFGAEFSPNTNLIVCSVHIIHQLVIPVSQPHEATGRFILNQQISFNCLHTWKFFLPTSIVPLPEWHASELFSSQNSNIGSTLFFVDWTIVIIGNVPHSPLLSARYENILSSPLYYLLKFNFHLPLLGNSYNKSHYYFPNIYFNTSLSAIRSWNIVFNHTRNIPLYRAHNSYSLVVYLLHIVLPMNTSHSSLIVMPAILSWPILCIPITMRNH